ncbi:MAG: hypothetical protein H6R10_433 [Rhodocyclaceae bacterium]|nr:hypothetical protein [Rhodocyclaceae bacterium]
MLRFLYFALVVLLSLALGVQAAERRVALVVGNSSYPGAPLRNPTHDAKAMAQVLKSRGFDVTLLTDAGQKEFNRGISAFGEKLGPDTAAVFYFAGHGMQVRGRNYLIPVDAQIRAEGSVRSEAIDVDAVLEQFQSAGSLLNLVILDACRNNPFERRFRSGTGGGLAQMEAPKGTLIAYATAPGRVAMDGEGEHGVYTTELLGALSEPGLKVEDVFKRVRVRVANATADQQIPWESSSLVGDFYFYGAAAGIAPLAPQPLSSPAPMPPKAAAGGEARNNAAPVRGVLTPEEVAFVEDEKVRRRLGELGLEVAFEIATSREAPERVDPKKHDFAFIGGHAASVRVQEITGVRRTYRPFFSILVLASWRQVADVLAANGLVQKSEEGAYVVDTAQLFEAIRGGRQWSDLRGGSSLKLLRPISVQAADFRLANSSRGLLALAGYAANAGSGLESGGSQGRTAPYLRPLMKRQGSQAESGVDLFADYVGVGISGYPLIAVDESEFIAYRLRQEGNGLADATLLYPQPGVTIKHTLIPLTPAGDHLGRALRDDPELRRLATAYGYRVTGDAASVRQWRESGLPVAEHLPEQLEAPGFDAIERLLAEAGK